MPQEVKFKLIKNNKINDIANDCGTILINEYDGKIYFDGTENRISLNDIQIVDNIELSQYTNNKFYFSKNDCNLYFYDSELKPINNVFKGATAEKDGTKGLVPSPTINDKDKFLSGDGTWKHVNDTNILVINKTLSLSNDWQDIELEQMENGSYVIQILINNVMYTGFMSFNVISNNLHTENEIILHCSGQNSFNIYLQTVQDNGIKLQISSNVNVKNIECVFSIKKII